MNNTKRNHFIQITLPDNTLLRVQTNEFRYRVWCALEAINKKLNRAAAVAEITEAYVDLYKVDLPKSKTKLKNLKDAVINALILFNKKRIIFIKEHERRFRYGSLQILDPNNVEDFEEPLPIWKKLLPIVKKAVIHFGNRPVRCRDVINYIAEFEDQKITQKQVVHHMWLMYRIGKLKIVDRIYGDGQGTVLFLPVEFKFENTHITPLTFADWVMFAFKQIWSERIEQSKKENCSIQPVLTSEIRKRLEQFSDMPDFGRKVYNIARLLKWHSQTSNPTVRKFVQANRYNFWAFNDIDNEDLDLENTYPSNAMKVAKAIERAYLNFGERPVDINAIKKEINNDRNLTLTGKISLAHHLRILGIRNKLNSYEKLKNYTFTEYIRIAGSIYGRPYFAPITCSVEKCQEFIELSKIKRDWEDFKLLESCQLIDNCQLISLRIGRARLLFQKILGFTETLVAVKSEYFQEDFERLYEEIKSVKEQLIEMLKDQPFSYLPELVNEETSGLTPKETTAFLAPFYPVVAKLNHYENKQFSQVTSRIRHAFNRIPNPDFEKRTAREYKNTVKFLFEKTDLLIKTALRWGGSECRYQALIAGQELGILRDENFVIPALQSSNFEDRQIAIACLAFLQKQPHRLKELAINDPIGEVRQAALWAFASMKGENYHSLARQVAEQDTDLSVRQFAEQIASANSEIEIWQM